MANEYQNPLFEKLKKAKEERGSTTGFKNLLKTKPDNTYIVRFVPNPDDVLNTFFRYYTHGWTSATDGRYISTVCPTTYKEECPICTERFRLWNKGDEASKELSKILARKERFFANVYVVEDSETPENIGTVKILGYGRQIAKIIDDATDGDDAKEVGGRMMDFSKEGCNLRIKVEKNKAGYPNYDRSKFMSPSSVDITEADAISQSHEFDAFLSRKSDVEIREMIEQALYGSDSASVKYEPPADEVADGLNAIDEMVGTTAKKTQAKKAAPVDEIPMKFETDDADDIMKDLENLA